MNAHLRLVESKVIDSRPADAGKRLDAGGVPFCQKRFNTNEVIETAPMMVIKKDGSIEAFDRNKLLTSMLRACEKRQVSLAQIDRAVDEIEIIMQNSLVRESPTSKIGELAMEKLKEIDEAAYVRFASVYRQFKDIGSFMDELKMLIDKKNSE
jgi:transcriptional repressor NrdR